MICTYAGLMVGNTQGSEPAIGEWIRARIRPDEIFPAARLQWPGYLSGGPVFDQTAYPWDHVEIDRLYWPCSASRFAHAHVVVDDVTLAKIRLLAYANQRFQSLDFMMDDGAYKTPITTKLWMLAARPLSTAAPGGSALYLLTLVDDRYYWWETSLQYDVTAGVTTWANLYTSIGTALGVTITPDTINSAYGFPTGDYAAAYRQAPIVLDAVAWSIGQRVVRKLDGTVVTMNATTALASQTAQSAKFADRKRRGGVFDLDKNQSNDLAALVPASMKVIYTATGSGSPVSGYASSTSLAVLALSQYPQPQISGQPWTKVLHRYEIATYAGGADPSNKTALDAITAQFAADWYLWQLARMERWHVGTVQWTPDGLSDIEWRESLGEVFTHVRRGVMNPQEDLIAPAPVVKGSACAARDRTRCDAGEMIREISYDCGTTWTLLELLGPCGDGTNGWPCSGTLDPITFDTAGPCVGGLDYVYRRIMQDSFDPITGCLRRYVSQPVLTATGKCCTVCGSSGSGNSGSGGLCAGLPCGYCSSTTPCQWTFSLTCPDFTGGGALACSICAAGTPTEWDWTGSGFTGVFAYLNRAWAVLQNPAAPCEWKIEFLGGWMLILIGPGGTISMQAEQGGHYIQYAGTLPAADCCSAIVLAVNKAIGTGLYPATITITPVGCGTAASCTPDPSGSWALTQSASQPCAWTQGKSGVTASLNLLYDPIYGVFELELVLVSASYTMVFAYFTGPGQISFDCTKAYSLALVYSPQCVCSNTPLSITLTPVATSAACCTSGSGSGGGFGDDGACCQSLEAYPATLYADLSGVTISGTCNYGMPATVPLTYQGGGVYRSLCYGPSASGCYARLGLSCTVLGGVSGWSLNGTRANAGSVRCAPISMTFSNLTLSGILAADCTSGGNCCDALPNTVQVTSISVHE